MEVCGGATSTLTWRAGSGAGEGASLSLLGDVAGIVIKGFAAALHRASGADNLTLTESATFGVDHFYEATPIFADKDTTTTKYEVKIQPGAQCISFIGKDRFEFAARIVPSTTHEGMQLVPTKIGYSKFLDKTGRKGPRDLLVSVAFTMPEKKDPYAVVQFPVKQVLPQDSIPLPDASGFVPLPEQRKLSSSQKDSAKTVVTTPLNVTVSVTETKDVNKFLLAVSKILDSHSDDLAKKVTGEK